MDTDGSRVPTQNKQIKVKKFYFSQGDENCLTSRYNSSYSTAENISAQDVMECVSNAKRLTLYAKCIGAEIKDISVDPSKIERIFERLPAIEKRIQRTKFLYLGSYVFVEGDCLDGTMVLNFDDFKYAYEQSKKQTQNSATIENESLEK